MDELWKLTELNGWGPDYSEIHMPCPVASCTWWHDWEGTVKLGEIVRTVQEHLAGQHGRKV